jgi:hypothetical protein
MVPQVDRFLAIVEPLNRGPIPPSRCIEPENHLRLHTPYSKDMYSGQLRRVGQPVCYTMFGDECIISIGWILCVSRAPDPGRSITHVRCDPFILNRGWSTKSHTEITIATVRTDKIRLALLQLLTSRKPFAGGPPRQPIDCRLEDVHHGEVQGQRRREQLLQTDPIHLYISRSRIRPTHCQRLDCTRRTGAL